MHLFGELEFRERELATGQTLLRILGKAERQTLAYSLWQLERGEAVN